MYKNFIKRFLDLVISIIAIPFLIIVLIVLGPILYLDDPGPVFYKSRRVGLNGTIFEMIKFRSMRVNSPDLRNDDGSTFNSADDSRQTRVGRIIRKYSIDELPQFINILKGEMSLIGPRPVLESQLLSFTEEEKGKLKVLPGITGYNQAFSRNKLTTHEERMLDAWYADNISFLLDLKIILKTLDTLVHPSRVYRN